MKPINFEGSNLVLKAPANMPECEDLHVRVENGVHMSVWELEPKELAQLIVERRIALYVHSGDTAPPVGLAVVGMPAVEPGAKV